MSSDSSEVLYFHALSGISRELVFTITVDNCYYKFPLQVTSTILLLLLKMSYSLIVLLLGQGSLRLAIARKRMMLIEHSLSGPFWTSAGTLALSPCSLGNKCRTSRAM